MEDTYLNMEVALVCGGEVPESSKFTKKCKLCPYQQCQWYSNRWYQNVRSWISGQTQGLICGKYHHKKHVHTYWWDLSYYRESPTIRWTVGKKSKNMPLSFHQIVKNYVLNHKRVGNYTSVEGWIINFGDIEIFQREIPRPTFWICTQTWDFWRQFTCMLGSQSYNKM